MVVSSSNSGMTDDDDLSFGTNLSAKSLIEASPQQHGQVLKLHVPILYTILPEFLKRIILSWSFLAFLGPSWKQRYLILCGSFLYKFNNQGSKKTKGSPFPVETTDVDIAGISALPELCTLPPGYSGMFSVSTLRREHYYAVLDNEEAAMWVRSLNEARQATITRNMGHSSNMPYPKSWQHFDSLGKGIVKASERVKQKIETSRMSEMEMTSIVGGPLPRGYYG